MIRKIINIDQEKCEGCGTCITECNKGAIQIVEGKATLINANVCDSLGSCIPKCPMYAISFAECDVVEFDKDKAINEMLRKMLVDTPPAFPPSAFSGMGSHCPCMDFSKSRKSSGGIEEEEFVADAVTA